MGRGYIIGDAKEGLTIVLTEPPLVFHYSPKDMHNKMGTAGTNPTDSDISLYMAAIVREVMPVLRGVYLDDIDGDKQGVTGGKLAEFWADKLKSPETAALLREVIYTNSIARTIRAGDSVSQVDFCVAVDVERPKVASGKRKTEPANSIIAYLNAYAPHPIPASYPLDTPNLKNLEPLPAWKSGGTMKPDDL